MGYAKLYAKAVKKQALRHSEKPIDASFKGRQDGISTPQSKEVLWIKAFEELKKVYPPGLYPYLLENREDLFKQLQDLEEKVEKAYLDIRVTVDELRAALKEYWSFHKDASKDYEVSKHNKHSKQGAQIKGVENGQKV